MKPIYLDYNATTPIDPRVKEAMLPYLDEHFGNPSSSHYYGIHAKRAVENARKQIADMLGAKVDEIIFTSGGTESNNYAIKGVAGAYRNKGNHIITSSIEHPAVLEVCRYLENHGLKVTYLPVDEYGMVDPEKVSEAITPQTILISIMHANNEIGTIQPIAEIARIAHKHGILVHSDCAQSIGKIPVHVDELQVDLLTIAGHKLYAPKGIGALFIRTGVRLEKLIHGASHEMNWRAGTENVIECVGLGKACEIIQQIGSKENEHLKKMRERLKAGLLGKFPTIRINGHPEKCLPNTLSVSFPGLEANTIIAELTHVAASAGAACHSDQVDLSHVLEAMHVPVEYAMGTIRFSVGRFTTNEEIDRAVDEISKVIEKLQPTTAPAVETSTIKKFKLTQYTHGLGCACKLRPQLLETILQKLPIPEDARVLVGANKADDAAIYKIDEQTAIVQTVDFFTPIVDDPFQFGAIAAANSLSDIYAMGGKPLFALNIVGFPSNRLPIEVLEEILKGAQLKAEEAGIAIIGGHTVDDTEPKFGLAVTGIIHPQKILTNHQAKPGDDLVLTKPIGTGILSTALKRGLLEDNQKKILMETMTALNKTAAEVMPFYDVHACTDITGFGLIGHLLEMMNGANTSAHIFKDVVPLLPGVFELTTANVVPGGTLDNFEFTKPSVIYSDKISQTWRLILNDAQTSGGLLVSLPAAQSDEFIHQLKEQGLAYAVKIGEVTPSNQYRISVE